MTRALVDIQMRAQRGVEPLYGAAGAMTVLEAMFDVAQNCVAAFDARVVGEQGVGGDKVAVVLGAPPRIPGAGEVGGQTQNDAAELDRLVAVTLGESSELAVQRRALVIVWSTRANSVSLHISSRALLSAA